MHQKCITFFEINIGLTNVISVLIKREIGLKLCMVRYIAELVTYIETILDEKQYFFKLKELHTVYSEHQLHSIYVLIEYYIIYRQPYYSIPTELSLKPANGLKVCSLYKIHHLQCCLAGRRRIIYGIHSGHYNQKLLKFVKNF